MTDAERLVAEEAFTASDIALIQERADWEYEQWDDEARAGAYTEVGLQLCAIVEKMERASAAALEAAPTWEERLELAETANRKAWSAGEVRQVIDRDSLAGALRAGFPEYAPPTE